jgi:hypothetical protein
LKEKDGRGHHVETHGAAGRAAVAPAAARAGGGTRGWWCPVERGREGKGRGGTVNLCGVHVFGQGLPCVWASCASPELCNCLGLACLAFLYA